MNNNQKEQKLEVVTLKGNLGILPGLLWRPEVNGLRCPDGLENMFYYDITSHTNQKTLKEEPGRLFNSHDIESNLYGTFITTEKISKDIFDSDKSVEVSYRSVDFSRNNVFQIESADLWLTPQEYVLSESVSFMGHFENKNDYEYTFIKTAYYPDSEKCDLYISDMVFAKYSDALAHIEKLAAFECQDFNGDRIDGSRPFKVYSNGKDNFVVKVVFENGENVELVSGFTIINIHGKEI